MADPDHHDDPAPDEAPSAAATDRDQDRGGGEDGRGDGDGGGGTEESIEASVRAVLGRLAAGLGDRGEDRAGQVEMAVAVARAVVARTPLAAQAGTGTGKSWAYLVGALAGLRHLDARSETPGEGRMVVATATKALQDQLADKDLPAMAAATEGGVSFAVLKGRTNYLCRQAASEASATLAGAAVAPALDIDGDSGDTGGTGTPTGPAVAQEVSRLVAWAETSTTGDRAELDFEPQPAAWGAVSVAAGECPGAESCPSGDRCFAEAAYARARAAEVVVVNLHLFGAHVASGGHVLPEHDVVIIDESHEAEDVMVSVLGVTLTPGRARAAARSARVLLPDGAAHATSLLRSADSLAAVLAPLTGRRLAGGTLAHAPVSEALDAMGEAARRAQAALRSLTDMGDAGPRRDRSVRLLNTLVDDIEAARAAGDEEHVTWVEGAASQPALRVAPIDVGPELARVAWSHSTAILTSATVPRGITTRLGLAASARSIDVGSPFDYRANALLYVPRLPAPGQPTYEPAALDEIRFLVGAAGGRTLALFTSWRAMRAAAAGLGDDIPYRVLVQGDLPKAALIEEFRAEESTCLFATMSFWQGVDVPGSACSLVIVDRIPFARPDDPLFEARRDRAGAAAFGTVDLPHAATKLAQGVGRLIRSATDRGVVAVLDSRLAERGYRRAILDALPPMRRTRDRSDVSAFFAPVPAGVSDPRP